MYEWLALSNIGSSIKYGFKSPARNLARLVDKKYGKVIDAPLILILKHTDRNDF